MPSVSYISNGFCKIDNPRRFFESFDAQAGS